MFDKWCQASKVKTFDELCKLILLEFKNCVPEKVAMCLNEQKVTFHTAAAVLADVFVLTHKNVFSSFTHREGEETEISENLSSYSHGCIG